GDARRDAARRRSCSAPSWTRDELAAAVRADAFHRIRAGDAERALEGADTRIAVSAERRAAALALGSHLETHVRPSSAARSYAVVAITRASSEWPAPTPMFPVTNSPSTSLSLFTDRPGVPASS